MIEPTESLLSVDPAANTCACADFVARSLRRVWSHVAGAREMTRYDRAVWEMPQGDGRAITTDDAVRVAAAGAQLAGQCAGLGVVERFTPREWKGSLPKAICHLRMWQALSDTERALLGGEQTAKAIANACNRGAKARWKKHANHHYSNRDLPKVGTLKITHDILDAVALGLWYLGRLNLAAVTKG